jgi:ribosomal-protein-alanine N-acetyltransferase
MIHAGLQVRRAVKPDQERIANLIFFESSSHRHLDWHSPLEWVGSPNYWVREEGSRITAVLACPEDPPHVAWIRFFGHHQDLPAAEAWSSLWDMAHEEIKQGNKKIDIAAIVVKHWFQALLLSSGFKLKQNIVLLTLEHENIRMFPEPRGIRIRPMQDADMHAVTQLDLAAFGQFWHNTEHALQKARLQCASATVAEDASGLIGYQLSTEHPQGAHLARLGVKPEAQGRGVGSALVSQLVREFLVEPKARLSVNTQSDNDSSLALYKKLGFVRTGEQFPVFVYRMDE